MPAWILTVAIALSAAVSASADVVPQKKWLEVRSPHVRVMGDVAARDLRRVAERMEQLHAALGQLARTKTADAADVTVPSRVCPPGIQSCDRAAPGLAE